MFFTPWLRSLKFPSRRTRTSRRRAARNRRAAYIGAIESLEDRTLLSALFTQQDKLTASDAAAGCFRFTNFGDSKTFCCREKKHRVDTTDNMCRKLAI